MLIVYFSYVFQTMMNVIPTLILTPCKAHFYNARNKQLFFSTHKSKANKRKPTYAEFKLFNAVGLLLNVSTTDKIQDSTIEKALYALCFTILISL